MSKQAAQLAILFAIFISVSACSTRDLQDTLAGSTAQRLLSHSIDDLIVKLPEEQFEAYRDKELVFESHFLKDSEVKRYADERLKSELSNRFNIQVVEEATPGVAVLSIFYTSLATDRDNFGITIPLAGIEDASHINVIALEKFHGVSEMYYFLGQVGEQVRSNTLQAVVKTDALGLPFITIPLSNVDRVE